MVRKESIAARAIWGSVIVSIPTLLGFFGGAWWVLDLFASFRVQLSIASLLCLLGALLRPTRAAWIAALPLVVNAACIVPLWFEDREPVAWEELVVASFNVHTVNPHKEEAVAYLRGTNADVIFLYEVDQAWLDAVVKLEGYQLVHGIPSKDNFGIAVLSRIPVIDHRALVFSAYGVPSLEVTIEREGRPIVLLGTHALPPIREDYAAARDEQLANIGEWSAAEKRPHAVVGDFNATPWSAPFRSMLAAGGLTAAPGLTMTWPYGRGLGWLFWIPIDHALVSRELTVHAEAGEACGSDHRPIVAWIGFAKTH